MKNLSQSIFKYKLNKSPLHKIPFMLKLFMLILLSILCMSLPPLLLSAGIALAIITAFICRFTIKEIITDLKPAAYYTVLMYALSILSNLFEVIKIINISFIPFIFLPHPDYLQISLRLILIVALSSLLFRTTSSLEIREGLCSINRRLGETISLFLCFIPAIFDNWNIINLAWEARGGKNGIGKIKTVVFILISLSMEKAAIKAKALDARR